MKQTEQLSKSPIDKLLLQQRRARKPEHRRAPVPKGSQTKLSPVQRRNRKPRQPKLPAPTSTPKSVSKPSRAAVLEFALEYAELGWFVFPTHGLQNGRCTCGKSDCGQPGKHPRVTGGFKVGTLEPERIREWWRKWPSANVAIRTGPASGFFVIDIDSEEGERNQRTLEQTYGKLPETVEQSTGRGRHLLFKQPGGWDIKNGQSPAKGIDIKAEGGYIVACPSGHHSGAMYLWTKNNPLEEADPAILPKAWVKFLSETQKAAEPGGPSAAEIAEAGDVSGPQILEGSRETALFRYVCGQRAKGLDAAALEVQAIAFKKHRCGNWIPDEEAIALARRVAERYSQGKLDSRRADAKTGKLILEGFTDMEKKETTYLWPGRFPIGVFTFVDGFPEQGKSIFTLDMAARVSTGEPWPDQEKERTPGSVILFGTEDDPHRVVKPRLEAAGADQSKIYRFKCIETYIGERTLATATDLEALGEKVRELGDCRLIIFDPLNPFLGRDVDLNNEVDVRAALEPLMVFAEEHQLAIAAIAHMNKNADQRTLQRISGSYVFGAVARVVHRVVANTEDDRRYLMPVKNNWGPLAKPIMFRIVAPGKIVWSDEDVTVTLNELMNLRKRGGKWATTIEKAVGWLEGQLADSPMSTSDLTTAATAAGITTRALKDAKDKIGVEYKQAPGGRRTARWCGLEDTNWDEFFRGVGCLRVRSFDLCQTGESIV